MSTYKEPRSPPRSNFTINLYINMTANHRIDVIASHQSPFFLGIKGLLLLRKNKSYFSNTSDPDKFDEE